MSYNRRVVALLSSKSRAQTSPAVYQEWAYLGKWRGWRSDVCQLCDHRGYTYRHIIRNRITGDILLIGSKCAEHWDLGGPGYVPATGPLVPPGEPIVPRAA